MAIAYRSGSTAGDASGGNLTITKPTGTVDGDILIAICYNEISASAWTAPSGWAQWGSGQANYVASAWINVYWKRAASEGANYQFSITTTWRIIAMCALSGALASGDPIDVGPAGKTDDSSGVNVDSQNTTVDGAMMLALHGNTSGADITTIESGTVLTQGAELSGSEIWYAVKTLAGATGATLWNASGMSSGVWATLHLAIKPYVAPSATQPPRSMHQFRMRQA